jgi:hypothetical protein
MAQKTNFNVSPYFDDFYEKNVGGRDKNYYKVLFNPGRAIQARELNTLQSILQNQVESFGSHIFQEGSMVIPGNIAYDNQFFAVKLNPVQYGVDLSLYLQKFVGKKIIGQVSGITATIKLIQLQNSEVEYPTIYVKYLNSDANYEINPFQDNELLYCDEDIVYDSTTITAGTPFANTILSNSTATGSAVSIGEGVYFIRGIFARVPQQTILLDYYDNKPSYRVGLRIEEKNVTAKDDTTLYDNAKGFTNYAAPGADRFQLSLSLTKKSLTDLNDTDFVELLRLDNGEIKVIETKSSYSLIADELARRTYDESGDYSVTPFQFSLNNSLNNRLGNNGLFFSNEKTEKGNTPSDNLLSIKLSPGKAYVKGYEISKTGVEILDVEKPRDLQELSSVNIPFEMGNLLRVNNVSGFPKQKEIVYLQSRRKTDNIIGAGTTIGSARVYSFNLTDAAYNNSATNWDLYLYDIQTYTEITLNQSVSSSEVPKTSYIKGKSSGASGFAVSAGIGSNRISLRQTSGTFAVGEQILINGSDLYPRSISSIKTYGAGDIKSVYQPVSISGFTTFTCDTQLDRVSRSETITITVGSGGISTATVASPATFVGIRTDDIIRYQRSGASVEVYNRVSTISPTLNSLTLAAVNSVTGVCDGTLPTAGIGTTFTGSYSLGVPLIRNQENAYLYAEIPNSNIATVDLSTSTITFSAQSNSSYTPTVTGNTLTVGTGNFNLGINSTSARFESFDEERYSICYEDGTVEKLTSDKVTVSGDQITFSNISNKKVSVINATFVKNTVQSKNKQFIRSGTISVSLSKNTESGTGISTSVNDGLTYNQYYGLRVQDEEICLRYPDVVKVHSVYESLDTSAPVLDKLLFSSIVNVDSNAIIGENIIGTQSNTVARIVNKPAANTLGVIYLNSNRFVNGETVSFEESNIQTTIASITLGQYKDITNKFTLDKGQKDQYYDYSKIIRKNGESAPSRQLLIVFDYYSVSSSDAGDVFTANSYSQNNFSSDVPIIGQRNIRSSDTLDFRPRVPVFTSTTSSPFDFDSRLFGTEPKIIMSPNESSLIGYQFYLGRIDKLYIDRLGVFTIQKGTSSINPKAPDTPSDVMEIATIILPPYLYNPNDATIQLKDNRRYTMRDIGKIEDRVENLETITSLSLLELQTKTLQIQDAQGFDRFKTGFFVDDFKDSSLISPLSTVQINTENQELTTIISRNSINLKPVSAENVADESLDLTSNFALLDSNTQKTGEIITLKYDSVGWINQPFATKVENVNPFHVVTYSGTITLNPASDSWVRTIRLEDVVVNITTRVARPGGGSTTTTTTVDQVVASGKELYMRSRNTGFEAVNLKPLTRYYQFLDGNSGVNFIPKLVEISSDSSLQNYGSVGSFTVGETVKGYTSQVTNNYTPLITFRVAKSNHKGGPYDSPTVTYGTNPYVPTENIPASYSPSSKTLNIDINSLSSNVQGLYSGYLTSGMFLVGQTSGATAYVKDLRLISDANGFLSGCFFIQDPNTNPPPTVRIGTGSKVYKLTSSSTNETPAPGSTLISSGETIYKSEGTWEEKQKTITTTTTIFYDPLAQSFTVGGISDTSFGNTPTEDSNGAYLTAVDLFFYKKDSGNAPVTVEIRTMQLGTPTRTIVGKPVTLNPSDIQVSTAATVATKVTFDYPIFLEPNQEYALVLLAPQTDQYEVWIAEMGEKTIETASLPDSQAIRYTTQFAVGSLFKSQNGSIWTANQYQDLKFKLYKAKFTSTNGSVLFHNPSLDQSNNYVPQLNSNPITILPRKVKLGITTITDSSIIGILTTGRKVSSSSAMQNYGYIVGTGSSVATVGITTGGSNYTPTNNVGTYAISGNGTGLRLNITNVSVGSSSISSVTIATPGNGYAIGDVVGIVTSDVSPVGGRDARITISSITGLDTLYLSNVQGQSFNVGVATLGYYNTSNTFVSLAGTTILSSTPLGGFYSGDYFEVNHFNHGLYSNTNKVQISSVDTDVAPTTLANAITASSNAITVSSTTNFETFEGVSVGSSNPGFIRIENEIIKYTSASSGTLGGITRGIDSTIAVAHNANVSVYKYELGGVSLRRINKTHNIASDGIDIDNYYIQIDRSNFDSNVIDRSSDGSLPSSPQISFNKESASGGNSVFASENIQFSSIVPQVSLLNPGAPTSVGAQIRTVSGTSVDGNEASFVDQQYESVDLGVENKLSSTRIVCSKVNEQTYLGSLLRNKSFTLKLDLSTTSANLSPAIFWSESSVELISNRLNNPISDYSTDNRVNDLVNDPHAAVYISNTVVLDKPASSLKVIVSAYRDSTADFRVLYSLIRPDSSEVEQSFELFPGYKNLTIDNNQDGFFDVVNPANNDGLPDVRVPSSLEDQFLDYEFSANNLGSFTGYTIKIVMSGTNQAYAPRFRDLRSIALA